MVSAKHGFILIIVLAISTGALATNAYSIDGDGITAINEVQIGTDPIVADTDGDGLDDDAELNDHDTDPAVVDTDGDSLEDGAEVNEYGADPTTVDTDGDSLEDGAEVNEYGADPTTVDTDGDGLEDGAEVTEYDTDPSVADTDGDDLDDDAELNDHETDPMVVDTDGDSLEDGAEVNEYGADPTVADTDGDGLDDDAELNDHDTGPMVVDTDDDSLEDGAEVTEYDTDPSVADTDGDGLDDDAELNDHDTDPAVVDTDGDSLEDGAELTDHDTDPTVADTDGDGLEDGAELTDHDTDPTVADTDEDGLEDGPEVQLDSLSAADPLRMDVFVEVDYIEGSRPREAALNRVVDAYDDAPIENPDGSTGISLHIVLNESIPAENTTTYNDAESDIMPEYFDHDGHGYHYAVAVVYTGSVPGKAGWTPDNGLFIFQTGYGDGQSYPINGTADVFMHELGHVLGLWDDVYEGIDSTSVPYNKYKSVMNYNAPSGLVRYNTGDPFDDWQFIANYTPKLPVTALEDDDAS